MLVRTNISDYIPTEVLSCIASQIQRSNGSQNGQKILYSGVLGR